MLKKLIVAVVLFSLIKCDQKENTTRPNDAIGVGREFIEASLKGKYDEARKYVLPDSMNVMYFERMENFYQAMPDEQKSGYKNSNIIINASEPVTDSVLILNYSNTFKKEPSKIKLVRIANEWWVDFKYSFSGNL